MAESRRILADFEALIAAGFEAGEIERWVLPSQVRDLALAMVPGLVSAHLANEPHLPVGAGR